MKSSSDSWMSARAHAKDNKLLQIGKIIVVNVHT